MPDNLILLSVYSYSVLLQEYEKYASSGWDFEPKAETPAAESASEEEQEPVGGPVPVYSIGLQPDPWFKPTAWDI